MHECINRIRNAVLCHPVVTVYGPEGAGKTKIISTEVLPKLIEQDWRSVHISDWGPALEYNLLSIVGKEAGTQLRVNGESLPEVLRNARRRSEGPVVFVLDPLDLLLRRMPVIEVREDVFRFLQMLSNFPHLRTSVILVVRESEFGLWHDALNHAPAYRSQSVRIPCFARKENQNAY